MAKVVKVSKNVVKTPAKKMPVKKMPAKGSAKKC